ncbi:MAG: MmgE/PrpD family protein [Alphaproteobacteria bacterium]|nr:MmgE/PrpD family protein [Alphaproteobacteria bacterium]
MSETLTERLANIVARPIDADTRARAARHLLDWVGCAAIGATTPAGRTFARYGLSAPAGPCVVLGAGLRDASTAAFVNGSLGNILELDDLHRLSIVHAGDVVIPAILAVAQRQGASGPALLDALVRGYESTIRIGAAAGTGHYAHWYPTATCGAFGAAVGAGTLLELSREQMVDALGQAGMQMAGLWQCRIEPTFSKQLASARAAQSGVISADLAAIGCPGPRAILEGPLGMFAAAAPDADPEAAVAAPDGPWQIAEVTFKPWPACRHAHPVIEAGLALRARRDSREIDRVAIATYREAVEFCDNAAPETAHEARFSLQHCVALALDGSEITLADFDPASLDADPIACLRKLVDLQEDANLTAAFPRRYGARVRVAYGDGSTDEAAVEAAKGDPENPLGAAEIEAKARTLLDAAGVTREVANALVQAIEDLPDRRDLGDLTSSLGDLAKDLGDSVARQATDNQGGL